jgi:hypothetical protein
MDTASDSTSPINPPTRRARLRLIVAAGLFAAWLCWLAWLAFTAGARPGSAPPAVLSRPQFLVSPLVVSADVEVDDSRPKAEVVVRQVLRSAAGVKPPAVGATITVLNLSGGDADGHPVLPEHWHGPGRYILPLVEKGPNYAVAAVPLSPGYVPPPPDTPPPVYPETPDTLHQLKEMPGP